DADGVVTTASNAVGSAALFIDADASDNNAAGVFEVGLDVAGFHNAALRSDALFSFVAGYVTVAMFDDVLHSADSLFNTAVGFNAGKATIAGFDNIYLGDTAGTLDLDGIAVPDESQTTRIGSFFTEGGLAGPGECYIGGIRNQGQVWNGVTVCQVT